MYGREEKHVQGFVDETCRIETAVLRGMIGRDDGDIKRTAKK
jgi:hypothetical protein